MKQCLLLTGLLFVLLLGACDKEEQVMVKEASSPQSTKEKPELIEQSDEEKDEVDQIIEFILPEEKVMINLEMVPILEAYLKAAQNRNSIVKSMKLSPIDYGGDSQLYLLEFSCVNQSCSYLLLDKTDGNQAFLVADLAKIKEIKLSPDNSKVFLQFTRENSTTFPYGDIVVIDIVNWKLLSLTNNTNDLKVLDYQTSILEATWNDNESIAVTITATEKTAQAQLSEWKETENAAKEIILTTNE